MMLLKFVSICLVGFSLCAATPVALSAEPAQVLLKVSANGIRNLRPFTVKDKWEIQWDSKGELLTINIHTPDGTFFGVAGMQQGPGSGSSYQPKGGDFYLQIIGTGEWTITVVQLP